VSIELPEATILARQMNEKLQGKRIQSYHLQKYERLQRIGMLNPDLSVFKYLTNTTILQVLSRGNTIRILFDCAWNLLIGPEYGGQIRYHDAEITQLTNYHLKLEFDDASVLTVHLTSMGIIFVVNDEDLDQLYLVRRDFDKQKLDPLDSSFTLEHFTERLIAQNRMLKSVLVGKNAILVGMSNSTFQDVIYRAKIHPKRKASQLRLAEQHALYSNILHVFQARIQQNGKTQFSDLDGIAGTYVPAMGPHLREQPCPNCGTTIERQTIGGGAVHFCSRCQV
jgi:formamidopyrimidine-DNA glycosylase